MTMCCLILALILVIYIAYKIYENQKGKTFIEKITNRYVFITGCDSGFGNDLARILDKQGVPVIAGCLTEKGGADLKRKTSSRLRVVQIDVTDQTSIRNAVESVKRTLPKSEGLWGLVNNAGIQVLHAPLEFHSYEAIYKCMAVNLFGAIEVTKAFLPLVRKAKGRVVCTTSDCAFQSYACRVPYVISKVGMDAMAECLRRELYYAGVTFHTIQPGAFKTSIVDPEEMKSTLQKAFDAADSEVQAFYGQKWLQETKEQFVGITKSQCEDLSEVTNALSHALFSVMPKRSYLCGTRCKFDYYLSQLPGRIHTWLQAMTPPPDAATQSDH